MLGLVLTAFWTESPVNTIKYSSSSSNLLFCCFFQPLSWECEAPCPTYSSLDSTACLSGATLKRELRSFGDEERGHMFGIRDNRGERMEYQTPAGCCALSRPPDTRERCSSKFTKSIRAYFYLLLKTQRCMQCRILLVSSPCTHLRITKDNFILTSLARNTWIASLNKRRLVCVIEPLSSLREREWDDFKEIHPDGAPEPREAFSVTTHLQTLHFTQQRFLIAASKIHPASGNQTRFDDHLIFIKSAALILQNWGGCCERNPEDPPWTSQHL